MWRVLYGPDVIYDPRDPDLAMTDMKGNTALTDAGQFVFSMPPTHPFSGRVECLQKDREIIVEQDGRVIWCGRAMSTKDGWLGIVTYTCEGERAYLNDVTLPPYSSAKDADVPSTVDGLFCWYVAQYNAKVDTAHRFIVGINEGWMLDPNNHILRESAQRPKIWAEVKEKLIDKLGGYVRVRHEGGVRYIDWLSDGGKACAQRIEFGRNLLDFARTKNAIDMCTAVVPIGARLSDIHANDEIPEGQERPDYGDARLGISELPDGPLQVGYEKRGDAVVSIDGVAKYGYVEQTVEFEDATKADYLLLVAARNIVNRKIGDTIEITAVDLHMVDASIETIALGSYVRATSKPHGLDEYFLCCDVPFTVGEPGSVTYTLGSTYDALTGRQSAKLAALNASISKALDAVAPISQAAKDAAKKADAAVVSSFDEYAVSDSSTEPPTAGWASTTPAWTDGSYTWRRVVTTYGNATSSTGAPAVMTGNSGEDATVLRLDSSRGTVFKNSEVGTTLTAVVFHGGKRITDAAALKSEYGATARIEWSWQRIGEQRFGVISASDKRISQDGFALAVGSADVDTKTVFAANLIT
ncbi:phage tail protein [Gordonibacter sp.]|uniref:phage tail protein n=1 Tax=Gordonibacter sp. TaxID=1968902 RepID=UPI002FC9BEC7